MSDEAALFGSAQIITPKYFRMITRSFSSLPDEKISTDEKEKQTRPTKRRVEYRFEAHYLSYLTYIDIDYVFAHPASCQC
jgi:ribose 1,5-bisphosphokinase PhnN